MNYYTKPMSTFHPAQKNQQPNGRVFLHLMASSVQTSFWVLFEFLSTLFFVLCQIIASSKSWSAKALGQYHHHPWTTESYHQQTAALPFHLQVRSFYQWQQQPQDGSLLHFVLHTSSPWHSTIHRHHLAPAVKIRREHLQNFTNNSISAHLIQQ